MILTRVHPGPIETVDPDAAAGRDRLLELYRAAPGSLRLNMVADVSGSAVGTDGTSESLTSRSDRKILGVIRELSDVVLVGAASVRAEGYQLPRRSRLAILTATGDLTGHRLSDDGARSVIVLCPPSAVSRVGETLPSAEVIPVPASGHRPQIADAIASLRAAGPSTIVCEGGPSVAGQLLGAGLIDELCVTTSPQVGGGSLDMFAGGATPTSLALRQLMVDDHGYVFARWSTRATSATA
ncbi:MAG: dihydrofolate reductase family protein [Rhodoglobus sp.]